MASPTKKRNYRLIATIMITLVVSVWCTSLYFSEKVSSLNKTVDVLKAEKEELKFSSSASIQLLDLPAQGESVNEAMAKGCDSKGKPYEDIEYNYRLTSYEHKLLATVFENNALSPEGISILPIFKDLQSAEKIAISVAATKLVRMDYLEKSTVNPVDRSEVELYRYLITNKGIDYFIENEALWQSTSKKIIDGEPLAHHQQ